MPTECVLHLTPSPGVFQAHAEVVEGKPDDTFGCFQGQIEYQYFFLLLPSSIISPLPFAVLSRSFLCLLSDSLLVHLLHFVLPH